MKVVRWLLGRIILLLNFIFTPRGVKRDPHSQSLMDEKTKGLVLYQFEACPFCVKVRRAMKRHGLKVETRDAKNDPVHRQALETQGGKLKVPCLRIEQGGETTWLYESRDIVAYLETLAA